MVFMFYKGNLDGLVNMGVGSEVKNNSVLLVNSWLYNEGMITFYNSNLLKKVVFGDGQRAPIIFLQISLFNYVTNAQRSGMGLTLTLANMGKQNLTNLISYYRAI